MASGLVLVGDIALLTLVTLQTGSQQEPVAQHEARENRTWSVWLTIVSSPDVGIVGTTVFDRDAFPEGGQLGNPKLIILQWSADVPRLAPGERFTVIDLLVAMGQKGYCVEVAGQDTLTGEKFKKLLWFSPFGMAYQPIPKAPNLDKRFSEWTDEDKTVMEGWLSQHNAWHSEFRNRFFVLQKRADARMEFPIRISIKRSQQKKEEEKKEAA
jgi:hypothetical protein